MGILWLFSYYEEIEVHKGEIHHLRSQRWQPEHQVAKPNNLVQKSVLLAILLFLPNSLISKTWKGYGQGQRPSYPITANTQRVCFVPSVTTCDG
jgi:hypothetical protein